MNSDNPTNGTDPWESEMSREFDKRVRDLHEAPLTFDNVKDKAMAIRRNRRIAVAGGILAAAAVVVPVAVLAGNGLGDSNEIPPTSSSPSPTQATDSNDPTPPTEAPVTTVGVGYLEGKTWHRADGSTVALDEAYFSAVELGDQLIAMSNTNGKLTVDVVDPDGTVVSSQRALSHRSQTPTTPRWRTSPAMVCSRPTRAYSGSCSRLVSSTATRSPPSPGVRTAPRWLTAVSSTSTTATARQRSCWTPMASATWPLPTP
jgi:hypothetical protein